MEGVGLGAVAAASKHGKFELDKLATWKSGQPVPFAFLADAFEAIAEESKRLVITSLLVGPALVACPTCSTLHVQQAEGCNMSLASPAPLGIVFVFVHLSSASYHHAAMLA